MSGTRWTLRNTGLGLNAETRQRRDDRNGNPQSDTPSAQTVVVGGFDSPHPGGVNYAFGDGSVQYASDSVALGSLQQLAHLADGKLLSGGY
jgi:prepilin-type processing-associated H-X9-DG protein